METLKNATKMAADPLHPYYPLGVEVVGYLANDWNVPQMLAIFFGGCAVIFYTTYLVVKRVHPHLPRGELYAVMWFVLTGCIHLFFEGYFALNYKHMAGYQDLFGQLWKEYAMSDSRYLTQNAFVLCMETVTAALWGPLSFVVAAMITVQHPLRHPLQALVSIGQIYGDILYYATSMFDHYILDVTYSRPEAYYFWGYYFFMNFIWIVIPGWLLYNSITETAKAFEIAGKVNKSKKSI
ncbi:EBDP4, emopamil-binding protein [Cryomyces antarcticus]